MNKSQGTTEQPISFQFQDRVAKEGDRGREGEERFPGEDRAGKKNIQIHIAEITK